MSSASCTDFGRIQLGGEYGYHGLENASTIVIARVVASVWHPKLAELEERSILLLYFTRFYFLLSTLAGAF